MKTPTHYEVRKGGCVLVTFGPADLLPGEDMGNALECARVYNAVEQDGTGHVFECYADVPSVEIAEDDWILT